MGRKNLIYRLTVAAVIIPVITIITLVFIDKLKKSERSYSGK